MCLKRNSTLFLDAKKTEIFFAENLIKECDRYILPLVRNINVNHFLITDENVNALYTNDITKQLIDKIKIIKIIIKPNEESKSFENYIDTIDEIIQVGIDKDSIIISLGGGVVNNFAGYIASCVLRGVSLIHIPTSLLAQVDAAIDFKQAINYKKRKNIIGSIYPPKLILIDPNVLRTLSLSEINNGFSEIIKHALTQDVNLIRILINIDISDKCQLSKLVLSTIKLKTDLINNKPDNANMIMQYGHLIGHALESATFYKLKHGEAIAIGMCISAELSCLKGFLNVEDLMTHYLLLSKYELPVSFPFHVSVNQVWEIMKQDKYAHFGTPICGLLSSIGQLKKVNNSFEILITKLEITKAINNNRLRHNEIYNNCNRSQ